MKTLTKSITMLLMMLLVVSCSKDEGLLSTGDELSDVLKGAKAKEIATPLPLTGWSNYKATVPKTNTVLDAGGPPCEATLVHTGGQSYVLYLMEYMPGIAERHVDIPLKISPGGVVKGYWPETWYDWGNPPGGAPNTEVVPLISGHVGCNLSGPGINKGTIICTGTFEDGELNFVFMFNGLDTGTPSTMNYPGGPPVIWDLIEGPAKFEFSFHLEAV